MIQYERQQKILQFLEKNQSASIKELADAVFASEASVRRDIASLEEKGYVEHIYGGVLLSKYKNSVVPLDLRDGDNSAVKEKIAQRAAEHIFDGATIMLDSSSTARRIMHYLDGRRNLKIITNNIRLLNELDSCDAQVWCTGGAYNRRDHALVGYAAESYVNKINADLFFFSSQGISEDGEITDASEEMTALRRAMLSRSVRSFFLCDSSKLGVRRMFALCSKDDISGIICDKPLPWEN